MTADLRFSVPTGGLLLPPDNHITHQHFLAMCMIDGMASEEFKPSDTVVL